MKTSLIAVFAALAVSFFAGPGMAQEAQGGLTQGVPVIVVDPQECPEPKRYTLNQDIYSVDNMIIRYLIEMMTSVSSEVQVIQPPDRARIDAYIDSLDQFRNWMVTSSPTDYPATYKLYYCLSKKPDPVYIASAPIRDLVNQLLVMEGELVLAQSSRLSSGILPQDDARFQSYLARMRAYLTNYHDAAAPNDHPRTTELTRLIEGTEPR